MHGKAITQVDAYMQYAPLHQRTNKAHTLSLFSNNMNLDEIFSNHLLLATSELMKKAWVGFKFPALIVVRWLHGGLIVAAVALCLYLSYKAEVVKYEERRKKNRKSEGGELL